MKKLLLSLTWLMSTLIAVSSVSGQEAATLSFDPDQIEVASGDSFTVDVIVDTKGVAAGGVGAKIEFDPARVSVQSINPGSIFGDYPVLTIDNNDGLLVISGISASQKNLFTGRGVVATIEAVAFGSGPTNMTFMFQPGSTRDSNVAILTGDGDALASVSNLAVTVSDTGGVVNNTAPTSPAQSSPVTAVQEDPYLAVADPGPLDVFTNKLLDGFADFKEALGIGQTESDTLAEIDPYEPLPSQPAITDANRTQASVSGSNRLVEDNTGFFLIVVATIIGGPLLVLFMLMMWLSVKTKHKNLGSKSDRGGRGRRGGQSNDQTAPKIVMHQPTNQTHQGPHPQPSQSPPPHAQQEPSLPQTAPPVQPHAPQPAPTQSQQPIAAPPPPAGQPLPPQKI